MFGGVVSRTGPRHLIHLCPSFNSDSKGAVVLFDGKVIVIHQETVNQANERIDRKGMEMDELNDSVIEYLAAITSGMSSGAVGIKISHVQEQYQNHRKLNP